LLLQTGQQLLRAGLVHRAVAVERLQRSADLIQRLHVQVHVRRTHEPARLDLGAVVSRIPTGHDEFQISPTLTWLAWFVSVPVLTVSVPRQVMPVLRTLPAHPALSKLSVTFCQ
jgi:hypothetical protein